MYPLTYQSYLSHLGEPSVCHKMSQVRRLWQLRRLVTKVVNEINREKFSRCTYFFRKSETAYLQWGRVMISLVFRSGHQSLRPLSGAVADQWALFSSLFQFDFVGRVIQMSSLALLICKHSTKYPKLVEWSKPGQLYSDLKKDYDKLLPIIYYWDNRRVR